jgi:poly(A) polymerase
MADLKQPIFSREALDILARLAALLAEGAICYLVGGAVRDGLLGHGGRDLDFALPEDPTPLARRFAQHLAAPWFYLDEQRCQSRVIVGAKGQRQITCDFSPFRGGSLDEDLALRDFTINAMAIPLSGDGSPGGLYDPLDGRSDLARRLLRICSPPVLQQDALRILKGIRHCAHLDLTIEQKTWQAMCRDVSGLAGIAGERLRDELVGILGASPAGCGLRLLGELQAAEYLFGPAGRENGFQQGLELAQRVEVWLEAVPGSLREVVSSSPVEGEVEPGISRVVVLKLAALLQGYRPVDVPQALARLKTGRRLQEALRAMLPLTATQFTEFLSLTCGPRGRCLWLEKLGGDFVLSLIFLAFLSGETQQQDLEPVTKTLADFQALRRQGRIPDLVDGRWLRKTLGLGEGPIIGRALSALREEEIAGRVVGRQDGEAFLASFIEKTR